MIWLMFYDNSALRCYKWIECIKNSNSKVNRTLKDLISILTKKKSKNVSIIQRRIAAAEKSMSR